MYDLFDYAGGSPDLDILVAHWAVFVEYKPILDAELAEQLVTVVTFFGVSTHF